MKHLKKQLLATIEDFINNLFFLFLKIKNYTIFAIQNL